MNTCNLTKVNISNIGSWKMLLKKVLLTNPKSDSSYSFKHIFSLFFFIYCYFVTLSLPFLQ